MNTNEKKILSIDLGFSSCKLAMKDQWGSLTFDRIINCTAQLDANNIQETDDESVFRFLDNYYALGVPALKMPRSSQIDLQTFEDLVSIYPIWISYIVKKYGEGRGFDNFEKIAIGLSPGFADRSDELLNHLYESLLFPPDKRDLFVVLPQGVIAKKALEKYNLSLRDTDAANRNATKLKNYIIMDSGFLTTDFAAVIGGKSSMSGAKGIPNSGCITICHKIVDYIYQQFSGLKLTLKEAMEVMESGVYIRRRVSYPMQEQVKQFSIEWIADTLNLLETHFGDELDRVEGVYWLGGGAHIYANLKDDPEVIKEVTKHFPQNFLITSETDQEQYNAVAYLTTIEEMLGK